MIMASRKNLKNHELATKRYFLATCLPYFMYANEGRREALFFKNYYLQAKAQGKHNSLIIMKGINYPVIYGGDMRNNQNIRGFNPFLEWIHL